MRNLKQTTVGVVAGGLLSLGSISFAAAQADAAQRIEIDSVTQRLNLSDEARGELAPLLQRLNVVFERRQEHWQQGDEIQEELAAAYDQIAATLSATELREFHWLLRETAVGSWAGRPMGPSAVQRGWWGPAGRGVGMRGGRGYFRQGRPMRGMRGSFRRGVPMRGMSGNFRRGMPMRGTGRGAGWGYWPRVRPDSLEPGN